VGPAGRRGRTAWTAGGDAVRLTTPWYEADADDIGVLGDFVGQPAPGEGSITFHPSTFRGPSRDGRILVRVSGGPGSISTPLAELTKTSQLVQLPVWRWRDGVPGRGRTQPYTVTVPLWDWTPGSRS
jgi:hypothetical protein